ncbi:MAG: putative peptidoglycan lipid flippase [Acidobacteriota bacterium]|nr:putative peptidoglycan lipid flippase [Acidobacteriota bacterium]
MLKTSQPPPADPFSNKVLNAWYRLARGTVDRRILRAMFTVGALTLLAKLGFVGRDLLVAWKFGRSSAFEAFLLAFVIPYTITNALSDSLTATFLPDFIKLREQGRHEEARDLYGGLLAWLLVISGAIIFLCVVAQPLYVRVVAASFSEESWRLMFYLLCLTAPAAFLNCVVRFWQSILNAEDKFFVGSAVGAATPIVSIALLFFSLNTGVFALSLGLLAGALVEITILGMALRRANHFLLPRWRGFSLPMRDAFGQWWRLLLSIFFINSMSVVDNAMAARFAAHGSVAALNYGRKAVTFPIDLSAIAFVTVILPYFSKRAAARDWHDMRKTLRRYLSLIFAINLPIVIALVVWSKPIVKFLFERGEFSAADTEIVSHVLAYYAFTLPFYVAFLVLMKLLSSLRENVTAIWFGVAVLISDVLLNYVLSKRMGVSGIALATPCVYAVTSLFLYLHAGRLLKRRDATEQS